ncbi:hypothetical protein [Robertkochia aurantiaca]|uniref:hypothetical protein n=1 Tax=Robertkochia aurantiaca TaxID=2873700 RepID=UPI001CCBC2A6|nr:hypothetical protein [Robertkochia sp. 3YJGBD-33]
MSDYTRSVMPYFELSKTDQNFPPAHFADHEGMLAVGGNMSKELLLKAYAQGIYYWHHPMKYVKWWSPDPRIILRLPVQQKKNGSSIRVEQLLTTEKFDSVLDHYESLNHKTAAVDWNWLPARMRRIFSALFKEQQVYAYGFYRENELRGGLFGYANGEVFMGEYLWATSVNERLSGLTVVTELLAKQGFTLIDMHKPGFYCDRLCCEEMSRLEFTSLCKRQNTAKP